MVKSSDPSDLSPESWVVGPPVVVDWLAFEDAAERIGPVCPTTPAAVQHGSDLDFWHGLWWGVLLGALLWVPILWLLWPRR